MHHKKGWMNRRKEGLFRLRFKIGLKRGKVKWVPESLVARCLIDLMNHELEQQILEDVKNE